MTKEEYREAMDKNLKDKDKADRAVIFEYAKSNNPYKPGDIIEDHIGPIIIKKVICGVMSRLDEFPQCRYTGIELTKKLEPRKRQEGRLVLQGNVRRKIGEVPHE